MVGGHAGQTHIAKENQNNKLPDKGIYRILILNLISFTVCFFIFKLKGTIEKTNFVHTLAEKCSVTDHLCNCPARDSLLTCAELTKTFILLCD